MISQVNVYVFESRVVKSGGRYFLYIPRNYQEKLAKLHGRRLKVIVIEESE